MFAPVRGEYVGLVAEAPLPSRALAFDIGTGAGVLAAVLARRGVTRIIDSLDLRRPIYRQTAAYGHFGREMPDFTWERVDQIEKLASFNG